MSIKTEVVFELAFARTRRMYRLYSVTLVEAVFARQLPQLELMTHMQASYSPGKITIAPDITE